MPPMSAPIMETTLLVLSLTGSEAESSSRTMSIGLTRVPVPALIWMICPPNAAASARYSRSGSMTITSSSRLRNMPAISCLTVKDLPPPDVPSTNPLEFMWLRRSARIGLPLLALLP